MALRTSIFLCLCAIALTSGCGKKDSLLADFCATDSSYQPSANTAAAYAFQPDPMVRSGVQNFSPRTARYDDLRDQVALSHLGGNSVLEGSYVDVRNGLRCQGGYGANDPKGRFLYSHSDSRFQEAMTYYYGDSYRSFLDSLGTGILQPTTPVEIWAHCTNQDNAFFARFPDGKELVCLGDSVASPGSSYSDDGEVTVHELEHATTIHTYSPTGDSLGYFWYDEAGALNEAISDFMSLMYMAPQIPSAFDPQLFSRWALGTFRPGQSGARGTRKCPMYDSSYPNCDGFPGAFSANSNHISYSYPDGLGWPYANNFPAPGYVRAAFAYPAQEEIHDADIIAAGAMWDVYENIKSQHGGNVAVAQATTARLILHTIANLPKPGAFSGNPSPVDFQTFGAVMLTQAATEDSTAVTAALTQRGLVGWTPLPSAWADVGLGSSPTAGVKVIDDPAILKPWLERSGLDPNVVSQGVGNGRLEPGKTVAIWFDIKNNAALTAGNPRVVVQISPPDSSTVFLNGRYNAGAISPSQAEIHYGKINGTNIVQALSSQDMTLNVPTGNSYFQTDPAFGTSLRTAFWVQVSPAAVTGKTVIFHLQVTPSNGPTGSVDFPVVIY